MSSSTGWNLAQADIFWGELAFYDHVLQVYENDDVLIETMAGFVETGINLGDCCVVFVTLPHMEMLNKTLKRRGIDLDKAIDDSQYISVDAEEMLSRFIVNGVLDEELFHPAMAPVFDQCRNSKRLVRASGEMVALLAARGNWDATLHLERLWEDIHAKSPFCVCCVYPKVVFDEGSKSTVQLVCAKHSKMISGSEKQLTEVYYKDEAAA